MNPVDFRNATYAELQTRGMDGLRGQVLAAWRKHGPCTTAELAARTGISVLSVRPRTHDLVALGFVKLAEQQTSRTEGTYRAATSAEALDFYHQQRRLANGEAVQAEFLLPS